MVVLGALPSEAIISGFHGVIDYYVHHQACIPGETIPGTPCARRWPRSPGHKRSPAVEAQWASFTEAVRLWNTLPEDIRNQYISMASGTPLSGYELFIRSYIKGLYEHEPPLP